MAVLRISVILFIAGLLTMTLVSQAGWLVVKQGIDPSQLGPGAGGHQWITYHVNVAHVSPTLSKTGLFVTDCDDTAGNPQGAQRSELTLYEDGRPLGPPHSASDKIRETGAGAYTYQCTAPPWTRTLIFSASDNSDPRTNGRQYWATYPIHIAPAPLLELFGLAAILAMVTFRGRLASLWMVGVWLAAGTVTGTTVIPWLAGPLAAFYEQDSGGYLHPALSALAGGNFELSGSRSFLYPGFLLVVLSLFKSIPALISVQAVMCLITAVSLAALPWMATIGIKLTPSIRILRSYLSAASLILFFHYGPIAYSTQALMPEMLYTMLSVLVLLLSILLLRMTVPIWILIGCGIGLYLTAATFYVRPSWGVAMVASGLLFMARVMLSGQISVIGKIAGLTIPGVLVVTTLVMTNHTLSEKYERYDYKVFGPITLLCHQAPMVIRSLDRQLTMDQTDHKALLKTLRDDLSEIVNQGPGHDNYNILGYDPNMCLYGPIRPPIDQAFQSDPDQISHFLMHIVWQAVLDEPISYLTKVTHHLLATLRQPLVNIGTRFSFDNGSVVTSAESDLFKDRFQFVGTAAAPLSSEFGFALLRGLSDHFGSMMILAGLVLIIESVWFWPGWRMLLHRWSPALIASGLLIGAILTMALSSTADVTRYRYPLAPFVLADAAIMILTVAQSMRLMILKWRYSWW